METHLLEFRILSLLRRRSQYLKYGPLVKEDLFESKETKYVHKLIFYYHKRLKGKKLVPLQSLFALVNSKIKETEAKKYREVITKIKRFPLTDEAIADVVVKNFVKRQLTKITIMDALHTLDHDEEVNLEKLRTRIDEALLVDSTDLLDDAYDYSSNPRQRLEEDRNEPRVATRLSPSLDKAMRRGLAPGELGIIVAPTSVGKTMILINIAYNAIKQAKRVIYITLELSWKKIAGRFDQLVARQSIEEIETNPMLVFHASKKLFKTTNGGLRIKDFTATALTIAELSIFLERIRKDFEFDLIVLDAADLMEGAGRKHSSNNSQLEPSIIIALRRMASKFEVPLWTASQATRIAGASGSTSLWDIAEDIRRANWADVVFCLSQSREDKEENLLFLDMAKNRIGEGNPHVILKTNYKHMRITGEVQQKDKTNAS